MEIVKQFVWECCRMTIILLSGYAMFKAFVLFITYYAGGQL